MIYGPAYATMTYWYAWREILRFRLWPAVASSLPLDITAFSFLMPNCYINGRHFVLIRKISSECACVRSTHFISSRQPQDVAFTWFHFRFAPATNAISHASAYAIHSTAFIALIWNFNWYRIEMRPPQCLPRLTPAFVTTILFMPHHYCHTNNRVNNFLFEIEE